MPSNEQLDAGMAWIRTYSTSWDNRRTGNEGPNTILGNDKRDWFRGYGGNDKLFGFSGHDQLRGNEGDDALYGGDGNDDLRGGNGSDSLYGGAGNDFLLGNMDLDENPATYSGYDRLQGGRGNDLLLAGDPNQTGTLGTSRAVADYTEARYNIVANLNVANVLTDLGTVTVMVSRTIEIDRLGNIPDLDAGGGNDLIFGSYVANIFRGGGGNDGIYGNKGSDTLYGEAGNDTLRGGDDADTIYGGADDDTLYGDAGDDTLYGNAGTNKLYGGANSDRLYGDSSIDILSGDEGDDLLFGFAYNDQLSGGGGKDVLDGGTGYDDMKGGAGDDIYYVDNALDSVSDESGIDTVRTTRSTYTLGADIENLDLLGTARIGYGNNAANIIKGNIYNNTLYGKGGSDTLYGGRGDDTLHGDGGADKMYGGGGNDRYYVDSAQDLVIESYRLGTSTYLGSGNDTVISSISYVLSSSIENLTLVGTGAINATGNNAENVLIGNAGRNTLAGKGGNDTYSVSTGDTVVEEAGGGTDLVRSNVGYRLSANVENLRLEGAANINGEGNNLNNTINGNSGKNTLYGYDGDDIFGGEGGGDTSVGGIGNDTYYLNSDDKIVEKVGEGTDTLIFYYGGPTYVLAAGVSVEVMRMADASTTARNLTGNAYDQSLIGNAADNVLNGGGGTDRMDGGLGNDTYVTNGNDTITEAANAGTDTVQSSVTYTLAANFENLTLTGSASLNGTGNGGDNVLRGNGGDNVLTGGAGNDTYYIQTSSDRAIEAANGGLDTVHVGFSYSLVGKEIENLVLEGSGNQNAVGNDAGNQISGNAGANRIEGGKGNDVLAGGAGQDTFVFHKGSGRDLISDFTPGAGAGHDIIQFDKSQYADFAAVMAHAISPAGDFAPLTFIVDGNDVVQLLVAKASLTAADFAFV